MQFTILIPHYKTGKMTAYCISQLLKFKGRHEIDIIVIDNSQGEGIEYLKPFWEQIKVLQYPAGIIQSHGLAYDFAMPYVETEYFITVESDSFPTKNNWLDYYYDLMQNEYDCAGSLLKLSGGTYIHPAGAMYRKKDYERAKVDLTRLYGHLFYYPNLGMQDGFPCHIVSDKPLTNFPNKHHSYNNVGFDVQRANYLPIAQSIFHQGMGYMNESFLTYAYRNVSSGIMDITPPRDFPIYRMGYEPGQWFCYWLASQCINIFEIPTEIKWMPGRENQQQEYTIMENGFKHLWGITAYNGSNAEDVQDIIQFKQAQMEELYASI